MADEHDLDVNPWEHRPAFDDWDHGWELSRRWHHGGHARTDQMPRTRDATPLQDVHLPAPQPVNVAPAAAVTKPKLDLYVYVEDGQPLQGVKVKVTDGFNLDLELSTDADGHAFAELEIDGTHQISLAAPIDLLDVPPADKPASFPSAACYVRRDDQRIYTFAVDAPVTFAIVRDRAELVSLDGWAEGRKVLVFGTTRTSDRDEAITVRGILRTALTHRIANGLVLVIGHADTKGSASDNASLAAERAMSVALYLGGARDGWAAHAFANADVATLQAALKWAAAAGIPCDPGDVDGDWGPATAQALAGLREHGEIAQTKPLGPDDWAAIYDLYDQELAKLLYTSVERLRAIKADLYIVQESYGEEWPVVAPAKSGWACAANRRVDIVHCPPHGEPLESAEEIYDGTYDTTHLDVGPEVQVRLRVVQQLGLAPVPMATMQLLAGRCTGTLVADGEGLVTFTTLRGESYVVMACADLWGSSKYLWGLTAETLPAGAP